MVAGGDGNIVMAGREMRIALGVEYDGKPYWGWQSQPGGQTVQDTLQSALSHIADAPVAVNAAGRTDTGVHGLEQVVHFDTEADRTERSWVFGTNSNLPADISVMWAKVTTPDFHARFSAVGKRYKYLILTTKEPSVFWHNFAWHRATKLDIKAMETAGYQLLGKHDFSDCFCAWALFLSAELFFLQRVSS